MKLRHHYGGWKPSPTDGRDFRANTAGLVTLSEVDPRANMPGMYNQLELGSCTANAVAANVQRWNKLVQKIGYTANRPSRLWIYYLERMLEGTLSEGDVGAYGRDGFKAVQTYGWANELDWPYKTNMYNVKPPQAVWDKAKTTIAGLQAHGFTYKSVNRDVSSWKQVLSNNQTISFGFSVYESFEAESVLLDGHIPMPQRSEAMLGGHEVDAVGYLQAEPNYVLCRNSWGTRFEGQPLYGRIPNGTRHPGYFLMPWDYIMESSLSSDFRTIPIAA